MKRTMSGADDARSAMVDPAAAPSFSDVESGEGGESGGTLGDGSAATQSGGYDAGDSEPFAGDTASVTGTSSLQLEVALLSLDAVDRVAAAIAAQVAAAVKIAGLTGVVLIDPGLIAAMRLRTILAGELAALETKVANAAPAAEGGGQAGFVVQEAAAALGEVNRAAQTVGKALSVFSVSSSYSGRRDVVRPIVLTAALAKHLAARGIEAQVPRYAVMPSSSSGFLDRVLALQLKCREAAALGTYGPDLDAAAQMVDVLLQALFGTNSPDGTPPHAQGRIVQQLVEADMAAAAIAAGCGVLTVELGITGGSYRAKKWILNALFGSDGLTYSGGAAATYFLLAGDRMAALASDTLYFASGHGKFRRSETHFSPTNIPGADAPNQRR